ncbi:legumin A [Tanacetum coccineum]
MLGLLQTSELLGEEWQQMMVGAVTGPWGEEINWSGRGQQGGSQQKSSNTICQGFDLEFLAEAFNIDKETRQMLKCESGQRGHIVMVERGLRENIDHISKADFYNPQAGHYTHLNSFKFPILKLLQLGAERGVLSSDQGGWKKKEGWVPKRDHPARPVRGPNDGPRPGGPFTTPKQRPEIFRADEQEILNEIKAIAQNFPILNFGESIVDSAYFFGEFKKKMQGCVSLYGNQVAEIWPIWLRSLLSFMDFTEYEAEALEALKSKLKGIIEKGVTFENKQVVSA